LFWLAFIESSKTVRLHTGDHNEIKLSARQSWDGADVWTPAELCVYRGTFGEIIVDHLGTEAHEKRIEVDFVLC
jgi:hypothetical protein